MDPNTPNPISPLPNFSAQPVSAPAPTPMNPDLVADISSSVLSAPFVPSPVGASLPTPPVVAPTVESITPTTVSSPTLPPITPSQPTVLPANPAIVAPVVPVTPPPAVPVNPLVENPDDVKTIS